MQEFNRLLDRVNGAKAVTEEALKRITINNNKLDDALSGLRGRCAHYETDTCLSADLETFLCRVVVRKSLRCVLLLCRL